MTEWILSAATMMSMMLADDVGRWLVERVIASGRSLIVSKSRVTTSKSVNSVIVTNFSNFCFFSYINIDLRPLRTAYYTDTPRAMGKNRDALKTCPNVMFDVCLVRLFHVWLYFVLPLRFLI